MPITGLQTTPNLLRHTPVILLDTLTIFICMAQRNLRNLIPLLCSYSPEQIISMLREAEVGLSRDEKVGQICRRLGISEQSYYRWRRENGGMKVSQARRLKDLERENIITTPSDRTALWVTNHQHRKPSCHALLSGLTLRYSLNSRA